MTELQASLMAIGGVIVVGVISYNKWQEWRAKKSVDQAFSPLEDDVLMGGGNTARQEPVLSPFEGPDAVVAHAHDDVVHGAHALHDGEAATHKASHEAADDGGQDDRPYQNHQGHQGHPGDPGHAAASASSSAAAGGRSAFIEAHAKPSLLDEAIDCIIPLALDAPLRGEKISAAFQPLHIIGNKPVRVIGENETGQWEPVAVGGIYSALQVGVQLATRANALTELEFSELVSRLNQLSDELGASPELPEMADTMAAARALHQQVHEFDAQLSINVRASGAPWGMATLKPALQRQGMELRPDGRLVMPDGEGGILFSVLTNAEPDETSRLITLLLPVARVAPAFGAFKAMSSFAKSLATRLSGVVVDDEGQTLSDAALSAIATQVDAFYQQMDQAGIPAGSVRAQRLFA